MDDPAHIFIQSETRGCLGLLCSSFLVLFFQESHEITPLAQGGAEEIIRLLVTKNPPCSFSCLCQERSISFERFPSPWQSFLLLRSEQERGLLRRVDDSLHERGVMLLLQERGVKIKFFFF